MGSFTIGRPLSELEIMSMHPGFLYGRAVHSKPRRDISRRSRSLDGAVSQNDDLIHEAKQPRILRGDHDSNAVGLQSFQHANQLAQARSIEADLWFIENDQSRSAVYRSGEGDRSTLSDIVNALMGSKPEARFKFIQERAEFAAPGSLDI